MKFRKKPVSWYVGIDRIPTLPDCNCDKEPEIRLDIFPGVATGVFGSNFQPVFDVQPRHRLCDLSRGTRHDARRSIYIVADHRHMRKGQTPAMFFYSLWLAAICGVCFFCNNASCWLCDIFEIRDRNSVLHQSLFGILDNRQPIRLYAFCISQTLRRIMAYSTLDNASSSTA